MGHDFPCWLVIVLVGLANAALMVACFAWVVRSGKNKDEDEDEE